jgi:hypothetical protein
MCETVPLFPHIPSRHGKISTFHVTVTHTEPFIISWTGAAIWSKTNSGPTGPYQHWSSLPSHVCTIPSASDIFIKCIFEVMFCEGVQNCLGSALIISIVSKWRSFSFSFNRGNRNIRLVWNDSHVLFLSKIPWWRKKCETVSCPDATASSIVAKVRGKV